MVLLSRDYMKVVIGSTLVSVPLIYFTAVEWLSAYPTRIGMPPSFFVIPVSVVLTIVTVACGFQVLTASNTNPVEHLKQE